MCFEYNNRRHSDWITLNGKGEAVLTPQDLDWMPAKWWKLVTGESDSKCKSMTQALKELLNVGMILTPDILRALSPYQVTVV